MNHVPGDAVIRRSRIIVPLILIALIGTLALVIGPSRIATAAPPICTAGATSCPPPDPEPTPLPGCPARTASSKPISTLLAFTNGGVTVERRLSGTAFLVVFDLQSSHAFKTQIGSCIFDDGVATRFSNSTNIQSTTTVFQNEQEVAVEVVPVNVNSSVEYRFRLKYQQNFTQNPGGNPKFRTCSLVLPSGLAPGQIIYVVPTACSTDG
jgi:hypothetical protein